MNVQTREPKEESQIKTAANTSPLLVLISAPSGGGWVPFRQRLILLSAGTDAEHLPRRPLRGTVPSLHSLQAVERERTA